MEGERERAEGGMEGEGGMEDGRVKQAACMGEADGKHE